MVEMFKASSSKSESGVFKNTEAALEQICFGDGTDGIDCAGKILSWCYVRVVLNQTKAQH